MKTLMISVLIFLLTASSAVAQSFGGATVGPPTVQFYYSNGMPMPYPVRQQLLSRQTSSGVPSSSLVPAPIAAPVLYPPYQTKPFMTGTQTHIWEGVVGGALITFVVYELVKNHKKSK